MFHVVLPHIEEKSNLLVHHRSQLQSKTKLLAKNLLKINSRSNQNKKLFSSQMRQYNIKYVNWLEEQNKKK